jgi:DNA-binding SARP family transcriptional activator
MDWEFRLLGPLEVRYRGKPIAVSAARQRAVLAILILDSRQVVADRRLIGLLWGDRPPLTARATLQSLVSRLRYALESGGAERILHTRAPGYQLTADPAAVDLNQFRSLVVRGRAALRAGRAADAADHLGTARRLWRGDPLADISAAGLQDRITHGFADERLDALEEWCEAQLLLDNSHEVAVELQTAISLHPLRERLHHLLMRALYGVGRQSEALNVYLHLRTRLITEMGVEPSRELADLQSRILNHDETLDTSRLARDATNRRGRVGAGR